MTHRQVVGFVAGIMLCALNVAVRALDYPYAPYNTGKMDPQLTGWPLTEEERAYVLKAEHERRPGREENQHKPALWPVTPSAGNWGGTSWLDTHANLVKVAQASKGPIDVLLVGDSITMQWGDAWPKHFPGLKTVNIGIGGDKTQNVLWRLDHGGVEGLQPKAIVLMIGNNNMFFTPETGIEPAAKGIQMCVANLREKFPNAGIIVVKILPAHAPGVQFYEDIKKTNAALNPLQLDSDPKVTVLDLWNDFTNPDGTLKKELFTPDNIHLTQEGGCELYARRLKPLLEKLLGNTGRGLSNESLCGVGLVLGQDIVIGNPVIREIVPDSPAAAQHDIAVGDRILAVAQGNEPSVSVKNLEFADILALFRGSTGSTVRLTIAHHGEDDSRARTVSLSRKLLDLKNPVLLTHAVPTLKLGDAAPKLSAGAWVQGEPINELEKGKVYLVEFWATWCGPCVASIPHLNEIAQKYRGKGLVVIGQNIWEQDTSKVKPFVEKMGDKMTYRVALDDDNGTMAQAWMKAAGENGIPTAFLVGKNGRIAWVGYPWTLQDTVIEQVLNGTYDVAKAAIEYRKRKQYEAITQPLWQQFGKALDAKEWADAEKALNEIEKLADLEDRERFSGARLNILLGRGELDAAAALADKISKQEEFKNDALKLAQISRLLLEKEELKGTALAIAHKLAVRANEAACGKDARILDTLARAVFMQGDKQRASELQEKVAALCSDADLKKEFQSTLDSYRAGKLKPQMDKHLGNIKPAPPADPVCGVGIRFDRVGQEVVINKIYAESPAAEENEIIVGDRILAVAQGNEQAVSVKNLDIERIKALIRGSAGSIVQLTIAHPGDDDSGARKVRLTRKDISNLVRAKGVKPVEVGDAAPKLSCGTWVQGTPVSAFDKDKVYLVDFWATTCGPCVALIPHLNEMADKYKDKGLVVIGQDIWDKDESKVEQLIKKLGAKMTYRVAMDDDRKTMEESWLSAAGEIGIPCAFLVGKDGKIAWIGHPGLSSLEGIIESVLNKEATTACAPTAASGTVLKSAPVLTYGYAPYNAGKLDPQLSGWPLTEAERGYVLKAEHERRPGREINQHKPALWPVVPSAGFWGGTSWLDTHANLVKVAQASKGPIDVLLVGDSITMQWGDAWPKHFPGLKTVNIGIGGDKTQNVLWRLDHGGVEGLQPRVCVLLIGNNNMFFTPETGIEPAAQGIKVCVDNLREKFPQAPVIVVKVFPAHTPGNPFYEDIKKVNAALDTLNLEADPRVRVLDIWGDMVKDDGTLKKELFTSDNIHLSQEGGYKLYAEKLKPLLEAFLAGKDVPKSVPRSYPPSASAASSAPEDKPVPKGKPAEINAEPARAKQVIYDDNLAAGWINNPMQATVNVNNDSPAAGGSKSIAVTTEPYGGLQLLRWGTALDTTLCKSLTFRIHGGAKGGQNLRVAMMNGLAEGPRWQIVPVPAANAWTTFRVALADLGVANTRNLYGLRIWEAGGADADYFLDDIQLTDEEVPLLRGVVFDDIFRGFWFNNAFAAEVVATNASPVHGGVHSLAVTITGGGGCAQISHGGAFPDTSPYDSLSFWIHGGPTGGQRLQMFVKRWDVDVPAWNIPVLKPNEWVKHTVPLSVLGAANATNVASIWFRDANTGTAQPTFYLDDIKFEASTGQPAHTAKSAPVEPTAATATSTVPAESKPASVPAISEAMLKPTPKTADGKGLIYPYAPYNEGKMDPHITGWPLTEAEKAWVAKGEYTRKPGHEAQKHLPEMWFVTPTAGRWGKDGEENVWVAHHAACIEKVRAMKDGIDVALLGDSITQGWGGGWDGAPFNAAWQKHFGDTKTVNLGIGGDRMENILWRLDHGALDGASPNVIVLMIGVNNAPLVFANGAPAASAAHAIKLCIENLRLRCPKSQIVLVKVLPAFNPANEVGAKVCEINAALDTLKLASDPHVHILDLWSEFTNADGTLKKELYSDGHLHLGPAGYEVFAGKLKTVSEKLFSKP